MDYLYYFGICTLHVFSTSALKLIKVSYCFMQNIQFRKTHTSQSEKETSRVYKEWIQGRDNYITL